MKKILKSILLVSTFIVSYIFVFHKLEQKKLNTKNKCHKRLHRKYIRVPKID